MDDDGSAGLRVAYLSTDYPYVSHTFIRTEIRHLEHLGIEVAPIALNVHGAAHLLSDDDRAEAARTYAVKATPRAEIAGVLFRTAARHPVRVVRVSGRLLRPYVGHRRRLVKRTLQLLEAVLVAERLRRAHISAIHAHMGLASATVAWFAAEFARSVHGRPVSWSMTVHGWSEFVDDPDAELREKAASASLVVAISDFTRSQLLRLLDPADWHKVKVVRCGIDPDRFPRRERTERGSTIVVTARLAAEKGHRVLLDAVAMLRDRGVDTTLRVIGDGPLADHLRARSRELDLDDRVQFLGAQEPAAVAAALREADVFCLPTFAEGLPVVLMEAMATGVPVITTYIAGIPELVCDGQTGRVVPAGRSDALAIALAAVLDPAADLQPMTDAARAAVLERHDARTNAVTLATLLRDAHAA